MNEFDLESAITGWRQRMLGAGIKTPTPLDELETHVRDDISQQIRAGTDAKVAFENAVRGIGRASELKMEFNKIASMKRNRQLACCAWVLFAVSFFLPAYGTGLGWQCAGLSASILFYRDTNRGEWMTIHLASLTLANIFMISSLLPLVFSNKACSLKWLRFLSSMGFVLVWSYLLLIASGGRESFQELHIGYYVWTASFLMLFISSVLPRKERERYAC